VVEGTTAAADATPDEGKGGVDAAELVSPLLGRCRAGKPPDRVRRGLATVVASWRPVLAALRRRPLGTCIQSLSHARKNQSDEN